MNCIGKICNCMAENIMEIPPNQVTEFNSTENRGKGRLSRRLPDVRFWWAHSVTEVPFLPQTNKRSHEDSDRHALKGIQQHNLTDVAKLIS